MTYSFTMILAFDTSSAACTAALFDDAGMCLVRADEVIGRGHSERLVPMIAELIGDAAPDQILVGVGPGSFTGIRVAIAAAHGMAIGWNAELRGMSSLALLAAGAGAEGPIAAAVAGGHGEIFVQQFDGITGEAMGELTNLPPAAAAELVTAELVVGTGADELIAERGWGEARDAFPSASNAFKLPGAFRSLQPKPIYARAPDARAREAA